MHCLRGVKRSKHIYVMKEQELSSVGRKEMRKRWISGGQLNSMQHLVRSSPIGDGWAWKLEPDKTSEQSVGRRSSNETRHIEFWRTHLDMKTEWEENKENSWGNSQEVPARGDMPPDSRCHLSWNLRNWGVMTIRISTQVDPGFCDLDENWCLSIVFLSTAFRYSFAFLKNYESKNCSFLFL